MNGKKYFLSLLMILLLNPAPIIAMLSKLQSTQEEQKYTQAELENQQKQTALLFNECKKKNPDTKNMLFFIQQGADVNAQDDAIKGTPLHYACSNKHLNSVKLLIENG